MVLRAGSIDSPNIRAIEKGRGYVAAAWDKMILVGLYASPNAPITSLQKLLDNVRNCVRWKNNQDVLILGDFNAKSTYLSPRTNPRGDVVVE